MVMDLCGNQLPKGAPISALSAGKGGMFIRKTEQGGPTITKQLHLGASS